MALLARRMLNNTASFESEIPNLLKIIRELFGLRHYVADPTLTSKLVEDRFLALMNSVPLYVDNRCRIGDDVIDAYQVCVKALEYDTFITFIYNALVYCGYDVNLTELQDLVPVMPIQEQ